MTYSILFIWLKQKSNVDEQVVIERAVNQKPVNEQFLMKEQPRT